MRTYQRVSYDWETMGRLVKESEPRVCEALFRHLTSQADGRLLHGGYFISYEGFLDFPPRIAFRADLDFSQEGRGVPIEVDRLLRKIAQECSEGQLVFDLWQRPNYPLISQLMEGDKVYGPEPEIPPSIDYAFNPKRENFIIKT